MSKQDKKEIAEIVLTILTAKKQDVPEEKGTQKEKKPKQEKNASPPHKKSDIPQILADMNQKESIDLFGNALESVPYKVSISPFYAKYNIQLDVAKYERKTLTYEQKHNIIIKQLTGVSKKEFTKQKSRHVKFLQEKLASPPETNIFGKVMSDKNLENWQNSLNKEVLRWESETFKE
jgi:hypothetical protein